MLSAGDNSLDTFFFLSDIFKKNSCAADSPPLPGKWLLSSPLLSALSRVSFSSFALCATTGWSHSGSWEGLGLPPGFLSTQGSPSQWEDGDRGRENCHMVPYKSHSPALPEREGGGKKANKQTNTQKRTEAFRMKTQTLRSQFPTANKRTLLPSAWDITVKQRCKNNSCFIPISVYSHWCGERDLGSVARL